MKDNRYIWLAYAIYVLVMIPLSVYLSLLAHRFLHWLDA